MKNLTKSVLTIVIMIFTHVSGLFAQSPGTVDQTFNLGSISANYIWAIKYLNNGKILVGFGTNSSAGLTRLNSDGSIDNTFNTIMDVIILGIDTLPNGLIAYKVHDNGNGPQSGTYYADANNDSIYAFFLDSAGGFGGGGASGTKSLNYIYGNQFVNPQTDGYVIYSLKDPGLGITSSIWMSTTVNPPYFKHLVPLLSSSLLPSNAYMIFFKTYNNKIYIGTNKGIFRFTMKFYSGGSYASPSDIIFNNNASISLDTSQIYCDVQSIGITSNGSAVIGGYFKFNTGFQYFYLTKLDSLGNIDSSFVCLPDNQVNSVLVDANDKITIAGHFTIPQTGIARLESDGTNDVVFNNNCSGVNNGIGSGFLLSMQDDGKILVGGTFNGINGHLGHIIRLNGTPSANAGICIVTVDSISGKNLIVWNKVPNMHTDTFNIYRETSTNFYSKVGSVPYTNLSTWIDTSAGINPSIQSNRYKITVVDSNSIEGPLSDSVKTIHLSVSQGINGESNLLWDASEGFAFSKYYIRRSTNSSAYILIDSTGSSNTLSYTDNFPPIGQNNYVVEAINPDGCTPTVMKMPTNAYGSSTSNIKTVISTGVKSLKNIILNAKVYPNPTSGAFIVEFNLQDKSNITVSLISVVGLKVKDIISDNLISGPKRLTIDIHDVAPGLYFLKLSTPSGDKMIKIAKN